MIPIPALYLILGMVLIALCVPLVQERVPPNRWYGFRVRKTMSDPHVWYAANKMAAKDMMAAGVMIMATAAVSWFFVSRVPLVVVVMVNLAAVVGSLGIALAHSFRELRRM